MLKKIIIYCFALSSCFSYAQDKNPFYVGHSLVNFELPYLVHALAVSNGKTTQFGVQVTNGSTLNNNYNNSARAQGTPYEEGFSSGNHNALIVTEAVPLQGHITWSETYTYANNFYTYAKENNTVAFNYYIYETWHCINSGMPTPDLVSGCEYDESTNSYTLWQPRLLLDFELWTDILNHVRDQNPDDTNIWMVPAGQAFHNLTNQINLGNIPGITSVRDLFSDDIHLTRAGNYFVACVMYATIYGETPEGLTTVLEDRWGNQLSDLPTPQQAAVMQEVAWNTVTNLTEWTGVTAASLSVGDINSKDEPIFTVYPNPVTQDYLTVDLNKKHNTNERIDFEIYNILGKLIKKATITHSNQRIDISNLSNGVYILRVKNSPSIIQKLIKK